MRDTIQHLITSPKTAAVISTATTSTGLGTVLEWIPDSIGKLATLIGIILSVILIRVHLASLKKVNLEIEIIFSQLCFT